MAGDGDHGSYGDGGLATNAALAYPSSVALDAAGNLYITDTFNKRIRAVLAGVPSVSVSPQQLIFSAASGGAPTAPQTLSLTSPVDGLSFSVSSGASWLQVNPASGASPRLIQVTADPTGLAPSTYQATITINSAGRQSHIYDDSGDLQRDGCIAAHAVHRQGELVVPIPTARQRSNQTISVSNSGGGALQLAATAATTTGGGQWLSASPSLALGLSWKTRGRDSDRRSKRS